MARLALVDAYETFMQTTHAYVNLSTDEDYNKALVIQEKNSGGG